MHDFNLKWNRSATASVGIALLLSASSLLAQHGGGGGASNFGRGQAFAGGTTGVGAGVHASGPAVIPPVLFPGSAYGHVTGSYGHVSGSYNAYSYSSNNSRGSYGSHEGRQGRNGNYRGGYYPLAYYAYPYYVTPTNGWVGDPSLVSGSDSGPVPDQSVYAELDVLHQQIDQLRADQQYAGGGGPIPPPASSPAYTEKAAVSLVLVFRDGTRTEVQDYAIVGQTFWDLSNHGTRKIPIAQLDLQASIKANDARGLDFPVSR